MKTKEVLSLIKAITGVVHLCFIYLALTWGYELVTWVTKTLAAPFVGGL